MSYPESADAAIVQAYDRVLAAFRTTGALGAVDGGTGITVTATRDANGRVSTMTVSDGTTTKTLTWTRDANGRMSTIVTS